MASNFKEYCDKKFGETNCQTKDGKPIYFDSNFNVIDTTLIELMFNFSLN